jgi:c-di-GMP-binding flagellar brake protein YcgR
MTKEDNPDSLERRKFSRFRDNIFIFGNLKLSPTEKFKAFTENISAGGLMLEMERDIPNQSELELEMYQPLDRDKRVIFSIPVLGRVVWTRKIEKDNFQEGENKYRVGIEFSEIKEEDRKRITKYVEEGI